ncbi:MAG: hypothetical protein ABI894_13910 [Ilumatobacteraceae bacterium]
MEVLVIESSPGIADTLQHRLVRDGHTAITCNDTHGGPCKGIVSHEQCPLTNHIDLAVLARQPGVERSLNEMGAVCAARHRVPMVTLYPGDEFGPGVSTEISAAVARRAVEAEYAAVVRRQLRQDVDDIKVERDYQRVHVTISVAEALSAAAMHRLSDRVRQAVRDHDYYTPVIDISVVRTVPRID